jgi:hypothetical protein
VLSTVPQPPPAPSADTIVIIIFPEPPVAVAVPEALPVPVAVAGAVVMPIVLALFDVDDREVNVMKVEGVEFKVDFDAELVEILDRVVLAEELWLWIDDARDSVATDEEVIKVDVLLVPG